jgi:hypothetical protein
MRNMAVDKAVKVKRQSGQGCHINRKTLGVFALHF